MADQVIDIVEVGIPGPPVDAGIDLIAAARARAEEVAIPAAEAAAEAAAPAAAERAVNAQDIPGQIAYHTEQQVPPLVAQAIADDDTVALAAADAAEAWIDNYFSGLPLDEAVEIVKVLAAEEGVIPVPNLLTNPDFLDGATGWAGANGTLTILSGGFASIPGSGSTSNAGLRADTANLFTAEQGDLIWANARMRALDAGASALGLHLYSSAGEYRVNPTPVNNPTAGQWMVLSGTYQVSAAWAGLNLDVRALGWWGSPANAAGKTTQVSAINVVNLTRVFGRGNEPTREQMDRLVGSIPEMVINPVEWMIANGPAARWKEGIELLATANGMTRVPNTITNPTFKSDTGWLGANGTITIENRIASIPGSGNASNAGLRAGPANLFTAEQGDVLYGAARMRAVDAGASALGLHLYSSAGDVRLNPTPVTNPNEGEWLVLSGTYQVSAAWAGLPLDVRALGWWGSPANAAGKTTQISSVTVVNLTRVFGAGSEPSKADMDLWISGLRGQVVDPFAWRSTNPGPAPIPPVIESDRRQFHYKGGVILRFDDGYKNIRELAAPYMAERGMVGYVAACPGIPGEQFIAGEVMANTQLVELYQMGWEIGNHVADHSTIAAPDFLEQVDEASRIIVQELGLPYPHTFTYPTGARNAAMDREMALRFHQAQLTYEPNTTAVRFDRPTFFTGWTVISGTATPQRKAEQIARMKRYVSGSISNGLVPVIAFHEVLEENEVPTVEWQIDWETFTEVIDWLYAEGYNTINPRDLPTCNLLVDGGFNEYPIVGFDASAYPWGAAAATGVWERAITGQHSGLGCVRVQSTSPVTGSVSQGIAVDPGEQYTVHMNANITARTTGTIELRIRPRLQYGDTVGAEQTVITINTTTLGYQDFTATFTAPAGTSNASVFIRAEGFHGTALVDQVSITPANLFDPLDV